MPYCCFKDPVNVWLTSKRPKVKHSEPIHSTIYLEVTEPTTPFTSVETHKFSSGFTNPATSTSPLPPTEANERSSATENLLTNIMVDYRTSSPVINYQTSKSSEIPVDTDNSSTIPPPSPDEKFVEKSNPTSGYLSTGQSIFNSEEPSKSTLRIEDEVTSTNKPSSSTGGKIIFFLLKKPKQS